MSRYSYQTQNWAQNTCTILLSCSLYPGQQWKVFYFANHVIQPHTATYSHIQSPTALSTLLPLGLSLASLFSFLSCHFSGIFLANTFMTCAHLEYFREKIYFSLYFLSVAQIRVQDAGKKNVSELNHLKHCESFLFPCARLALLQPANFFFDISNAQASPADSAS